jgi:hypothetical protein
VRTTLVAWPILSRFSSKELEPTLEEVEETPQRHLQEAEQQPQSRLHRRPALDWQTFGRSLRTTIPTLPARASLCSHWPAHPRRRNHVITAQRPSLASPQENQNWRQQNSRSLDLGSSSRITRRHHEIEDGWLLHERRQEQPPNSSHQRVEAAEAPTSATD